MGVTIEKAHFSIAEEYKNNIAVKYINDEINRGALQEERKKLKKIEQEESLKRDRFRKATKKRHENLDYPHANYYLKPDYLEGLEEEKIEKIYMDQEDNNDAKEFKFNYREYKNNDDMEKIKDMENPIFKLKAIYSKEYITKEENNYKFLFIKEYTSIMDENNHRNNFIEKYLSDSCIWNYVNGLDLNDTRFLELKNHQEYNDYLSRMPKRYFSLNTTDFYIWFILDEVYLGDNEDLKINLFNSRDLIKNVLSLLEEGFKYNQKTYESAQYHINSSNHDIQYMEEIYDQQNEKEQDQFFNLLFDEITNAKGLSQYEKMNFFKNIVMNVDCFQVAFEFLYIYFDKDIANKAVEYRIRLNNEKYRQEKMRLSKGEEERGLSDSYPYEFDEDGSPIENFDVWKKW